MKRLPVKGKAGEKLKNELLTMRGDFEDGQKQVFERMSLCEDFVIGQQWDPDDYAYNESKRRYSLSINQILPTVMQVTGQEAQNPRDIQIKNLAANTATKCRLISALVKQAMDQQRALRKRSAMFQAGVNTGRGYIGIDRDFTEDPERGDLSVKQGNSFLILPDPGCQDYNYNSLANGARGIICDEWVPKELIHGWWPKQQNELKAASYTSYRSDDGFAAYVTNLFNSVFNSGRQWEVSADYRSNPNRVRDDDQTESQRWKHSYRVSMYWYRKYKPGALMRRLDRPDQYMILLDSKAITAARDILASDPNQPAVLYDKDRDGHPYMVPVLHKAIMVGNQLLEAWEDPFEGIHEYPWVRFSPYFNDGYEFGLVDNLIGPQQTLNASWSMAMNLIKQLANSGYKVGEAHKLWLEWLEQNGGNDGIVIPLDKFGGVVDKLEANPYPTQFDAAAERSSQHIAEIANVRREMPAYDSKNMSGRAIIAKQTASMTGSASPFGNYDDSSEMFGVLVAKHIIQGGLYSEEEIRLLVDESDLIDQELYDKAHSLIVASVTGQGMPLDMPVPPDPDIAAALTFPEQKKLLEQYSYHKQVFNKLMDTIGDAAKEMSIDMLLDELPKLKYGKFAAKATLAESASTYRELKNAETMDLNELLLASGYEPIPRDILIKSTDVAYKDEILAAQQGDGKLPEPASMGV